MAQDMYDLIIVGAGPGGISAAIYAARARMNFKIFESALAGGQMNNTEVIENYPGIGSSGGMELAKKFEEHAKSQGIEIEMERVREIQKSDLPSGNLCLVVTEKGKYQTKTVIVATGGTPKKLGVPGESEFAGKGVSYCAVCDAPFFKGKTVAVLGGGNAAFEEGIYLTKHAKEVLLVHRRREFRAVKSFVEKAMSIKNFKTLTPYIVKEIYGSKNVEGIAAQNVETKKEERFAVDGVFVYVGFLPNTDVIKAPIERDAQGFIITDVHCQSSIPGIFAIGDVRSGSGRQIAIAVGDGATAQICAQKYAENLKSVKEQPDKFNAY